MFSRPFGRIPLLLIALVAVVFAAACGNDDDASGNPSGASEVTLRLGYFPNLTHPQPHVGLARGTFAEELGDNVRLETLNFNAGGSVIEALFANEIDISYIGPSPALNGHVQSKGRALRIISGATSGGALFIVRPEAGIEGPEDLRGKRIATPQLGNTQDVALRDWLIEHGYEVSMFGGGDLSIRPTANPDILTLFRQGSIDGAWVPEPWGTRLIQEAGGRLFLDERDLWPGGDFVTTHIIVRTTFLEQHPDVVRDFLRAHVLTTEWINENTEEARDLVNDEIERITTVRIPERVLDAAWANIDITYDPISASLVRSAQAAYELGFLEAEPDLSNIYALDLLNEVLAELGLEPVQ